MPKDLIPTPPLRWRLLFKAKNGILLYRCRFASVSMMARGGREKASLMLNPTDLYLSAYREII